MKTRREYLSNFYMKRIKIAKKIFQRKKSMLVISSEKIEHFLSSDNAAVTASKFLLTFIAISSVVFVGAAVPGLMKAIDIFNNNKRYCKNWKISGYSKERVTNSLAYLKKKKLIVITKEKDGKMQVRITTQGKKRLAEYSFDALKIKKPEKWDGKWKIFMFDIPANSKAYQYARNALRNKIKQLGFYQIQKSVWVYPYECEDELLFVSEALGVQQYIEILTVERLLHGDIVKKKFSLC